MASAVSTINFGARVRLAITLFNEHRFQDCKRELAAILGYPELPRYHRIKCHMILAECQNDWYTADRELQTAESMWWNCRFLWPPETADKSTNRFLARVRTMLDSLRASLDEEEPLDNLNHDVPLERNAVEAAKEAQRMFSGTTKSGLLGSEPSQEYEQCVGQVKKKQRSTSLKESAAKADQ